MYSYDSKTGQASAPNKFITLNILVIFRLYTQDSFN